MKGKRKRRRQKTPSRITTAPVMHTVRLEDVVVWNLDARYRPELEVDLEVTYAALPKPAKALASGTPPLGTAVLLEDVDIPFFKLEDLVDDDAPADDGALRH